MFRDGIPRHPTQAYESLFHLAMAGVLVLLMRYHRLRNHRLQVYLIAYGVYRFLTELIRPEPAAWLDLTFYQWVSLLLVAGIIGQWVYDACPSTAALGPDLLKSQTDPVV